MTQTGRDLQAIHAEARLLREQERQQLNTVCPTHGEPLDFNSAGVGNCPFGDYRQAPRTTRGDVYGLL